MRLDKYLSDAKIASRSESAKAVRRGAVSVNGAVVRDPSLHINEKSDEIHFCGEVILRKENVYIMLNKPKGYVSSTDDKEKTVMELLSGVLNVKNAFPCGRLDKDTTGLLLITDDGILAHELLSPSKHVEKTYRFETADPLTDAMILALSEGVDIGHHISRAEKTVKTGDKSGKITVTEGKFHQIKRMFHAVGTEICELERISFGPLVLDSKLERGSWRYLSENEENALLKIKTKRL